MIAVHDTDVHRFTAFGGARCEIHAAGVCLDDLSAAVAEVYAFEARLTRFDSGSELCRFNVRAGDRVDVSPLLEELLRVCLEAHALSDGLVNAAVLPALVAAGYDRSIELVRRRSTVMRSVPVPPPPPLPEVLSVGRGWARLAHGHAVDLGGVGKGWLADRLGERLENAVINLGGDLRAIGRGPVGAGWLVALCDGGVVRVDDAGIATSGVGGRRWTGGHHLIDPRTGRCADTDVEAVSVVAGDAFTAEVLAKAAVLIGAERTPGWLSGRGAQRIALRRSEIRQGVA
ncbi:MAG: FAD:protein FMN transferase [Chloroflexi bacterium]|nr:MAG: FAD:protein FMN transferase [Chloroflexota bacterium]